MSVFHCKCGIRTQSRATKGAMSTIWYMVTALHMQIRSQTYSLTAHTRKELITFSAITIYPELASH